MTGAGEKPPVLLGGDLKKTFRRDTGEVVHALDGVSIEARRGELTALVGPDGAGKTTLIRLAAGLLDPDSGQLTVLGVNVVADPQRVQSRIGYMPQRFGLYEDLTVQENLDLYADLHGVLAKKREERYALLMEMTALGPFKTRLAGQLSGGMKQKLGLACTLIRSPELLLLDEPTVGVDPLSRRELWEIILDLVNNQGLSVLLSTSYLDEAERCEHVVVLHRGKVLADGRPSQISELAAGRTFLAEPPAGQPARELQARLLNDPDLLDAVPEGGRVRFVRAEEAGKKPDAGALADVSVVPTEARFEDGFMVLLRQSSPEREVAASLTLDRPPAAEGDEAVVEVHDLVRKFGTFTAVDHVSFEVHRGEIFGLLGPNGAGKTTTFRMLCGLLAATGGTLRVAGVDLRHAPRVGPAANRIRRPEVLALWPAFGDREPRLLWQCLRPARRHGNAIASTGRCGNSTSRRWRGCPAGNFPADSSRGFRWPPRSCTSRKRSSSMSRRAGSTRWPAASFGTGSPRWPSRE